MVNILSLIILWWCRRIPLFLGAIHWNMWGKGLHWALFLCDKSPQKSSYVFSLFFYLDSAPLGSSCELCWGPLCVCDEQPTGWTALLLGWVWWLAGVTRTLSLSHQQVSPDYSQAEAKFQERYKERGSLWSFLRPDHRADTTSLVMHFLKAVTRSAQSLGVDTSASQWGKLRSHIVKGLAVVKEKLWSFVPTTTRMAGCSFNYTWNISIGLKAF